jgi:hypothetical protein
MAQILMSIYIHVQMQGVSAVQVHLLNIYWFENILN